MRLAVGLNSGIPLGRTQSFPYDEQGSPSSRGRKAPLPMIQFDTGMTELFQGYKRKEISLGCVF